MQQQGQGERRLYRAPIYFSTEKQNPKSCTALLFPLVARSKVFLLSFLVLFLLVGFLFDDKRFQAFGGRFKACFFIFFGKKERRSFLLLLDLILYNMPAAENSITSNQRVQVYLLFLSSPRKENFFAASSISVFFLPFFSLFLPFSPFFWDFWDKKGKIR